MKTPVCLITVTALTFALFTSCSKAPQGPQFDDVSDTDAPMEIKTDEQKNGYAVGVDNAEQLREQLKNMNVDMKALARGFSDEMHERQPKKLELKEIQATIALMRKKVFDKAAGIEVDSKKAGYCIGLDHGNVVKQQAGPDVDLKALAQGFADELAGRPKKMSSEDIAAAVKAQRSKQIDQMMAEGVKAQAKKPEAAKNLAEAKKFLEENAKKEGVKTTASGLQYVVLQEGTGAQPAATDKVTVHYQGTLLNGTVFDSSYKRGEPISFALNEVIKGWTEGVQLMKAGSKYKFFIPPELGYGEGGAGATIGPNAALIFEVELLKVN